MNTIVSSPAADLIAASPPKGGKKAQEAAETGFMQLLALLSQQTATDKPLPPDLIMPEEGSRMPVTADEIIPDAAYPGVWYAGAADFFASIEGMLPTGLNLSEEILPGGMLQTEGEGNSPAAATPFYAEDELLQYIMEKLKVSGPNQAVQSDRLVPETASGPENAQQAKQAAQEQMLSLLQNETAKQAAGSATEEMPHNKAADLSAAGDSKIKNSFPVIIESAGKQTDAKPARPNQVIVQQAAFGEDSEEQINLTAAHKNNVQMPEPTAGRNKAAKLQTPELPEQAVHSHPPGHTLSPEAAVPRQQAISQVLQSPALRETVVDQVLQTMIFSEQPDGEKNLYVRLKPAVLGEVEIRLKMEAGQLTARIVTDNVQVKELLESSVSQLTRRLETQQVFVSDFTVTVGHEQGFAHGRTPWKQHKSGGQIQTPSEADENRADEPKRTMVDLRV